MTSSAVTTWSDFATPVQMVDVDAGGSQTSIDIRASGDYDYLAYQTDNTFVVSVKPLTSRKWRAKHVNLLL